MDDASIIELYFKRKEQAIEETKIKYGRLCFDLASNMLGNDQDSEECVNDTYMTVWNTIPPTRPDRFSAFLCKITKNHALKKLEYSSALKRSRNMTLSVDELGDCVSGKDSPEDEIQMHELSSAISRFLRTRKEREQIIFIKRYWFYEPLSDIAEEFGITEKNVSLILYRTRQKLKDHLTKEGFDI